MSMGYTGFHFQGGERNSDVCLNKGGKDLCMVHTGGVLAIDWVLFYTSCRPIARLLEKGVINVCRQSQEQHNVFSNLGMHLIKNMLCNFVSGTVGWITGLDYKDAPKFDL